MWTTRTEAAGPVVVVPATSVSAMRLVAWSWAPRSVVLATPGGHGASTGLRLAAVVLVVAVAVGAS